MESALWVLGIVAGFAVLHLWVGPWLDRRAARRVAVKQERVAIAFLRLYNGKPPRRGR